MKVLFIQPLKAPKTVEIDGSLESMQKLVGYKDNKILERYVRYR